MRSTRNSCRNDKNIGTRFLRFLSDCVHCAALDCERDDCDVSAERFDADHFDGVGELIQEGDRELAYEEQIVPVRTSRQIPHTEGSNYANLRRLIASPSG